MVAQPFMAGSEQLVIVPGERQSTTTENSTTRARIQRGDLIRSMIFRLHGTLTNVEATNDIATTQRGDFFALIGEMRIVRNNGDVIWRMDGPAIPWWLWFHTGIMPRDRSRELGIGTAQASGTSLPFDVTFEVPYWLVGTLAPKMGGLDARVPMSELHVEIDWAEASDVDTTATAIASGILDHWIVVSTLPAEAVGAYMLQTVRREILTITAANTALLHRLPETNWIRSILLGAVSDTVEVSTIINNVTWRSGTRPILDNIPGPVLQEWTHQHFRLDRTAPFAAKTAGVNTVDLAEEPRYSANSLVSPDSRFDGWYFINPLIDGDPRDLFPAGGVPENHLNLNVSAPGTTDQIHIYPTVIRQGQEER